MPPASRDSESSAASDRQEYQYARRVLIGSCIFITLLMLALFLWYAVYVLFLIFAGVLLAIFLRALSDAVSRYTTLGHRWSLAIVLVVLIAGFSALAWMMGQSIYAQVVELSEQLPRSVHAFRARLASTPVGRLILERTASDGGTFSGGLGRVTGFLSSTINVLGTLVVVGFVGLFVAFDPMLYVRGTLRLFPHGRRKRMGEVMGAIGFTLKWWLIGQGISMVVVTVATYFALLLLGVPLALVLGLLAGLFNFIPNFGPLISMIPAVLLALAEDPTKAIWVVVLFILIQNLEGNVLTPLIQRRAVALPPAVTITAQLLLTILVGFVGLALATPIAAAAMVAVKMLYVEDVLGDELDTPDDRPKDEVRAGQQAARDVR